MTTSVDRFKHMSDRTRTLLIVGVVLGAALVWGVVTGQFQEQFEDIATIWNYFVS